MPKVEVLPMGRLKIGLPKFSASKKKTKISGNIIDLRVKGYK